MSEAPWFISEQCISRSDCAAEQGDLDPQWLQKPYGSLCCIVAHFMKTYILSIFMLLLKIVVGSSCLYFWMKASLSRNFIFRRGEASSTGFRLHIEIPVKVIHRYRRDKKWYSSLVWAWQMNHLFLLSY